MQEDMVLQGIQPLPLPQKATNTIYIESNYTFKDGDSLYMTIKAKPDNDYTDADALLKKEWVFGTDCDYDNEGYLALNLTEADTSIDFGDYYYDIKLVNADNKTPIAVGPCKILPVMTLRV